MSDDLVFSDELAQNEPLHSKEPWQVMVVDDEPAVHEVTELVMSGFEMDGRNLHFVHCYSGREAHAIMAAPNDIALILLDVVMETEHAGLDLARQIRHDLQNPNVRIILRTGQPGQAPEEQVIRDYDINDYKEKTDLTRRKLITIFYSGLRAYRDLMRLERARQGLRRSIEAISEVYDSNNLRSFASAVLQQVNFLLNLNAEGLCAARQATYAAHKSNGRIKVLAATQAYSDLTLDEDLERMPQEVQAVIHRALQQHASQFDATYYAGYFKTKAGSESIIYMAFPEAIDHNARELLELFARNVAVTYDGLLLRNDLEREQLETIAILANTVERSGITCVYKAQRIGHLAAWLAHKAGCDERQTELMRLAIFLHDIGKVGLPESILTHSGPLSAQERTLMNTHVQLGGELLSQCKSQVHEVAKVMALEHHEHWDGNGHPHQLRGDAISLAGRIAAVADVLDSLLTDCNYRKAWSMDEALTYLQTHAGQQFDPELISHFGSHRAEVETIYSPIDMG